MSKLLFSIEEQPAERNTSSESISNDRILEKMAAREELKDMFVQLLPSHWLQKLQLNLVSGSFWD